MKKSLAHLAVLALCRSLEPPLAPQLGTRPRLDEWPENPLLPVILGERLDIPGRDMRVVHRGELAPDMSNAIGIVETVRTGPGTPFADIGHQDMDETAEWSRDRLRIAQAIKRTAMQAGEDAKNAAMASTLHAIKLTEKAYFERQLDQAIATIERHVGKQYPRMATLASPRGSMGEEVESYPVRFQLPEHRSLGRPQPAIAWVATPPKDPHCAMTPQCPGALGKGCYLCEPGEFEVAQIIGKAATDTAQDVLDRAEVEAYNAKPRGYPLPFDNGTPSIEWSGIPGDPFIHLERTRRTPLGAEPWDHGAGEAA